MRHAKFMNSGVVVIRGGGDIGTGVAHRLFRSGFDIIVVEITHPLVIRRKVAFAQAIVDGHTVVEGIKAVKASRKEDIDTLRREGKIPVMVDPDCSILREIKAEVVVDATLAKENRGMRKSLAPLTIALGPGFKAGEDVDVVIETTRGHNLGKVIIEGYAESNTGIPEEILGYKEERVLRAPCEGVVRTILDIGDAVKAGEIVCYVDKEAVKTSIGGVVRGLIMNATKVVRGIKIGDVDPRGIREYCFTISDKARAVGGGVLEAILYMKRLKKL